MSTVQVSFPRNHAVELAFDDAQRLIEALWAVSTTVGAVAAVGKLRHALVSGSNVVVGDNAEATAMQTALERAGRLTPALERVLAAASAADSIFSDR